MRMAEFDARNFLFSLSLSQKPLAHPAPIAIAVSRHDRSKLTMAV